MKHTVGLLVIFVTLTACGDVAAAQQPAKTPRIGFLFVGSKDQPHLESFHQGLRELGYVDGKNISIEYRYPEGKSDALPALAAELVALNVDVIVTTNPNGSRAVQGEQHDSCCSGGVRSCRHWSCARPSGNVYRPVNQGGS
jgi:ABC-type uncharacterized transport system substrate-binding protein